MKEQISDIFREGVECFKNYEMQLEPDRIKIAIPDAKSLLQRGFRFFVGDGAQWHPSYDEVAEWMTDNKGKSLLLMGSCGLGKTVIATKILPILVRQFCKDEYGRGKVFRIHTGQSMNKNLDELLKLHLVVLDDVGTEGDSVSYGERRKAFAELVDEAERTGHLLVITTNLTPDGIREKYGERTMDRLKKIARAIVFSGKSFRDSNNLGNAV